MVPLKKYIYILIGLGMFCICKETMHNITQQLADYGICQYPWRITFPFCAGDTTSECQASTSLIRSSYLIESPLHTCKCDFMWRWYSVEEGYWDWLGNEPLASDLGSGLCFMVKCWTYINFHFQFSRDP